MYRVLVAVIACAVMSSRAVGQSFDFEGTALGYYQHQLVVTNGGQTLTATPEGDPNGFLVIANDSLASNLGTRSLVGSKVDPLQSGQFDPVRFTFALPVDSITFAFGDGGGDSDSPVTIQAFDSASNLLGTMTDTYPAGYGAGKTLSGSFGDASYFILSSGSDIGNENSIYWEVVDSTVGRQSVPEPSSSALLCGFGAVAGLFLRRRR